MRIQFPSAHGADAASLDTAKQRTNRSADRAPWQSAATDRTINPMAQKGVGKRLSNAPRRRAY